MATRQVTLDGSEADTEPPWLPEDATRAPGTEDGVNSNWGRDRLKPREAVCLVCGSKFTKCTLSKTEYGHQRHCDHHLTTREGDQ